MSEFYGDFDSLRQHIDEVDPTNDHIFIARFEGPESSDRGEMEINVNVTDSSHQGVSICLSADGTWSFVPIGG